MCEDHYVDFPGCSCKLTKPARTRGGAVLPIASFFIWQLGGHRKGGTNDAIPNPGIAGLMFHNHNCQTITPCTHSRVYLTIVCEDVDGVPLSCACTCRTVILELSIS